jgi:hypothetical protein
MGGFRVELMDDKGGLEAFVPADIISWIQSGFDNFFNDARGDVDHLRNPTRFHHVPSLAPQQSLLSVFFAYAKSGHPANVFAQFIHLTKPAAANKTQNIKCWQGLLKSKIWMFCPRMIYGPRLILNCR